MEQEDVLQLIERLHQLHLQRVNINDEEASIIRVLRNRSERTANRDNRGDGPEGPPVVAAAAAVVEDAVNFQPGDNVFITNRISHVRGRRRATEADRAGVVLRTTPTGRLVVYTYNGHQTNRDPTNLRALNPTEVSVYRRLAEPLQR